MKGQFLAIGLVLAVLGAVSAGLYVLGGPQTARQDRLDRETYDAMLDYQRLVTCNDRAARLPMSLAAADLERNCRPIRGFHAYRVLTAETRVPEYDRLSDQRYRLCGHFHDAERLTRLRRTHVNFDSESGCLEGDTSSALRD